MKGPVFLTLEEVLAIHDDQITSAMGGGATGVRSMDLIYSAIAQPEATFAGEFLHPTLWDQAAAYAFHLAKNHPFVDGNKRTAFSVAVAFLALNNQAVREDDSLVEMMVNVAEGKLGKEQIAEILRSLAEQGPITAP